MDYGRPVQFGCFLTPDATSPYRALELATEADELATILLEHGSDTFLIGEDAMPKFAADVAPRVRGLIAAGRESR